MESTSSGVGGRLPKHGGASASGLGEPWLRVLGPKSPRTLELQRAGAWEREGTDGDDLSLPRGVRLA